MRSLIATPRSATYKVYISLYNKFVVVYSKENGNLRMFDGLNSGDEVTMEQLLAYFISVVASSTRTITRGFSVNYFGVERGGRVVGVVASLCTDRRALNFLNYSLSY